LDSYNVGYTGRLGVKYIVEHCAIDLKWAVGGRSHAKLSALVDELHQLNPNRQPPGIITADSDDLDALVSLAKSTKVVISFAGPFMKYFPVVRADVDWEVNLCRLARRTGHITLISLERFLGTSLLINSNSGFID